MAYIQPNANYSAVMPYVFHSLFPKMVALEDGLKPTWDQLINRE